jgi:carbonic anhydrase
MAEIIPVNFQSDILPEYRGTPVGLLLEYHNLGRAIGSVTVPQLLIGMCMDSRKSLRIPNDFAFVLRTAGANMRDNEFRISYAIAVGGVRTIVLIAHTDCGMARLAQRRDQFIHGLMEAAGWDEARATRHFENSAP